MWQGKKKAVTFSFDDGVTQDIRLINVLNKYGLKGTFNLNSALLGLPGELLRNERRVLHNKVRASQVKEIYAGHEIAVHTLTHPDLRKLDEETIERQVMQDRRLLTELVGYDVIGMAYPFGILSEDGKEVKVLKERTPIRYARTVDDSGKFDLQENLLAFAPTTHWAAEGVDELIDKFLALDTDEPQLFYIWGHSYELDQFDGAEERFEKLCQKLAGREDIFYGTNREVLL